MNNKCICAGGFKNDDILYTCRNCSSSTNNKIRNIIFLFNYTSYSKSVNFYLKMKELFI